MLVFSVAVPPFIWAIWVLVEAPYATCSGLGYGFTPYQRLWLYNGAPSVGFYDTLGIRRTYSRLTRMANMKGGTATEKNLHSYLFRCTVTSPPAHPCAVTYMTEISLHVTLSNQSHSLNVPALHRHGATLFIRLFRETAPFSRLLWQTRLGYGGRILILNPRRPYGGI